MAGQYEKMAQFLRHTPSLAADQALGLALQSETEPWVSVLAYTLLARSSDESVGFLIQAWHKLDPAICQALVDRCPGISGSLRQHSRHKDPQVRANVIRLIATSGHPKLAYILTGMLHDESPALRTQAAETFRALAQTVSLKISRKTDPADDRRADSHVHDDRNHFFSTLAAALETFTHHRRIEIVEAAMYLADFLPDEIWKHMIDERMRVGRVAVELLQRDPSARFAGFAGRALTCSELGKHVVRIIAASRNGDFLKRWLDFVASRTDPAVRKNLARINHPFPWLEGNLQPLLEMPPETQTRFVDMFMLTSIPSREKLDFLSSLLTVADPVVQRHVLRTLIVSRLPHVPETLQQLIASGHTEFIPPSTLRLAREYLENNDPASGSAGLDRPGSGDLDPRQCFEEFWSAFDRLNDSTRRITIERLRRIDGDFDRRVREKIAAHHPDERIRALGLIRAGGLAENYFRELLLLCGEKNPSIRSAALRALGDVPGPVSQRKVLEALDDPDFRVQANAIEALDTLDPPDLEGLVESKLTSPNNRIRANAIKAILKPQHTLALRVLDKMLDHPDPTFRRSALWAVIQITPLHLVGKINKIMHGDPDSEVQTFARQALAALVQNWKETQSIEQRLQAGGTPG